MKAARDEKNVKAASRMIKGITPLMKAARDEKDGKVVSRVIEGMKSIAGGSGIMSDMLNEKENDYPDVKNGGCEDGDERNTISANGGEKPDEGSLFYPDVSKTSRHPKEGGWAAIHFACDSGNHEGLRYLLEAGADPNLTERQGATPLHRVILGAGKHHVTQLATDNEGKMALPEFLKSNDNGKRSEKGGGSNGSSIAKFSLNSASVGKMALPGVVRSGTRGSEVKHLDDYLKCVELLLSSPMFDLMVNDRSTTQQPPVSAHIALSGQGLPEYDGLGFSPLCLCVNGPSSPTTEGRRDALYSFVEVLLTRGFDPNATMCGVSALHIALRNAHYGCAFALTRAGANINAIHPDGKTALQASELIYGESFTRELREASVVAMAVADPTRRRDLLRSQGEEGAKKLAKRAMNAGHSFIKASRWREAAGAYSEAASYGPKSLPMRERFECLRNMSECFLQVERGLKSEEIARQLLREFPRVPLAKIAVGEAMSHPRFVFSFYF